MDKTIDHYLKRQAELGAGRWFSRQQDPFLADETQSRYARLIPDAPPGPGQQYAFEVDLDKCTGCKGCVTGCHHENGLSGDEIWRSVELLQGGVQRDPVLQHVTGACHHCVEPACLRGCPVKAYEKLPSGVVKHLDDQCIGCQYCLLQCPYGAPQFNKTRGIVRKCDMCVSRLEVGEVPACVRGCANGAIKITLVHTADVVRAPQDYVATLPNAPDSKYTLPTTRYTSKRKFPSDMASDNDALMRPQHAHMPLVIMLVLTQLSVGAFGAHLFLRLTMPSALGTGLFFGHIVTALAVGLLALNASLFHLGRPQYAFRAVLGVMSSWLSREIVVFGIFSLLGVLYALYVWPNPFGRMVTGIVKSWFSVEEVSMFLAGGVLLSGLFGLFCSVMVYKDTRRPFWDHPATTIKFFFSAGITGMAAILWVSVLLTSHQARVSAGDVMALFGHAFCLMISVLSVVKLSVEASVFFHLKKETLTLLKKTALLMARPLRKVTLWRFACGVIGGIFLPLLLMNGYARMSAPAVIVLSGLIFILTLVGEFLERYLFFKAMVPWKQSA